MIISKATRKIVLNLKDPNRVLTVVPTAKAFKYKGRDLVAVPHSVDEVRVLRNLGFSVPAPISSYYQWSGRYKPFEAQLGTAAFLTSHNRAFCLSDMGCVDSETEYLSPTGWVKMSEYVGGDVAQYWPDTGAIDFVAPTKYVKLPCSDMIRIKTKYGVDQLLSPEHRVLTTTREGSKTETLSAAELLMRHDDVQAGVLSKRRRGFVGFRRAAIPTTFSTAGGAGLGLSDAELRVMTMVIADGYFPNKRSTVSLRLKKQRKIDRARTLLDRAGIQYRDTPCLPDGFRRISFTAPTRTKVFGPEFWGCTNEQLKIVADEVLHWDGNVTTGRDRFSSFEKQSSDFIQYVFASQRRVARVTSLTRARRGRVETEHAVQIRKDGKPLGIFGAASDGTALHSMCWEPSTDGFKYCFMVPSTYLLFRRNGCIFASGNTGKTLSTLWSYDWLRSQSKANKMLIVAPLSTLERTWADEIFDHFPHLTWGVLHGTREKRLKVLASDADVYLINHDGLGVIEQDIVARKDIDVVVIDEIASFRNASTDRWKSMNRVVSGRRWVWGLTGTPTPNAPTDAWAQCKLISPDRVPKYGGAFKDLTMRQVSQYKWLPRDNATEVVAQAMQPSIRYTMDQCIDLPPCVHLTRHVDLTLEQSKAYKEMMTTLFTELAAGDVLAVNEAVKMQKMVQICSGVVYAKDGTHVELPSKPRIDEALEIIEQAGSKTIVFVPYKGALNHVAAEIGKHYSVAIVNGETSSHARSQIFGDFQRAADPHVIVAQPAAMSHGITLTAADTIVWYAPITSPETYSQANARVSRPGQKLSQRIIHIEGSPVERKIYERLKHKQKLEGALLDIISEQEGV